MTSRNTAFGLALLVGGVILIVLGFNASHSIGSDVSRMFNGTPSDKAIWMLVGGVVALVIGLVSFLRGPKGP